MPRHVPRFLAIDIGNTSVCAALVQGNRVQRPMRFSTRNAALPEICEGLSSIVDGSRIDGAVAASVVPGRVSRWTRAVKKVCGRSTHWVDHHSPLGVPITYPKPETIGPDRLANAAGAAARHGVPVVVADFGTALTFDIVGHTDGYRGGIIAPGLSLMFRYLAERTALLPRIEPGPVRGVVGKNTAQAMRIGSMVGYRGMVREIFEALLKEIDDPALTFVVTGGDARWVVRQLNMKIVLDPYLTLFGLARIGELMADSSGS